MPELFFNMYINLFIDFVFHVFNELDLKLVSVISHRKSDHLAEFKFQFCMLHFPYILSI